MVKKFNPGDKIRCLANDKEHGYKIGDVFNVMKTENLGEFIFFYDNLGHERYRHQDEFEPVEAEPVINLPETNAYPTVCVEPFSIETPNGCVVAFETGPLGDIRFEVDNELYWDVEDIRYLAATLNRLADKIEEAKNA